MKLPKYLNKGHHRLTLYKNNLNLFKGRDSDVFRVREVYSYWFEDNQYSGNHEYLTSGLPKMITNIITNLIWSEPPSIHFEDKKTQEWFDNWRVESSFDIKGSKISNQCSIFGESIAKLAYIDGEVQLFVVDPQIWFPDFDPGNPERQPTQQTLWFESKIKDSNKVAILLETHREGEVEYQSFVREGNDEYTEIAINDYYPDYTNGLIYDDLISKGETKIIETKCKYSLLFRTPNYILDDFFGYSDYTTSIKSKVYAINQLYNIVQDIYKLYAHPFFVVPRAEIDQKIREITETNNDTIANQYGYSSTVALKTATEQDKINVRKQISKRILETKILAHSPEGNPEFIDYKGDITDRIREHMERLRQGALQEAQIAKILIDPDVAIGGLSGVAIQRLAQPTLHKVKQKQMYLNNTLRKMIYTAIELHNNHSGKEEIPVEYPTIKWRDGLVNDIAEAIDNQTKLLDQNLIAPEEARSEILDEDIDVSLTKIQEIQEKSNQLLDSKTNNLFKPITPLLNGQDS